MSRGGATALVVLASLLLVGATLAAYGRIALYDSDQFADRAAAALQDPSVRTLIGERVTDRVVLRSEADLLAARPIIASAVSGIVGGGAFRSLFRRAVLDAHRAIFERDRDTLTLTLADVGTVVAAALEKVEPELAADLDAGDRVVLVKRRLGSLTGDVVRIGDRVRILAYVLAALSLAAAAAALAVSRDRRRTAAQLGLGLAAAGVTVVVVHTVARAIVVNRLSGADSRDATAAVWDAFLGDLRSLGWVLAGSGAVVAAAAASLIQPIGIEAPLRAAWRIATTEPDATWLRLLRAAALVAAGVLLIAQPLALLQIAVTLAGVYLLYKGLESVLRMIYRPPDPQAAEAEAEAPRPRRRRSLRAAVPLVAVLLIAGAVTAFAVTGGTEAPAQATISACNGSAALCDRPLDEIVLPATHNSMSVPLPGWFSAEQERPIGGQLEDGIRGLLLDTHYADKLPNGRTRTYFGSKAQRLRAIAQDGVSDDSVEAALRLRERLGFRGEGERGMYLCHTFCELGATPLATGLEDIHAFLVTHPAEVVVLINQDYVTPADFVEAVGDAGLTRYVFKGLDRERWPTLREMIASDQRLVLLAENHAGAAPWYQLAYKRLTEETPYTFTRVAQLTGPQTACPPNRGPADAPLFLINHWISTDPIPKPSDASRVNAYAPLLARAEACRRIRDHLPNLLAVNFYKRGDVFRVVDALNGVREP